MLAIIKSRCHWNLFHDTPLSVKACCQLVIFIFTIFAPLQHFSLGLRIILLENRIQCCLWSQEHNSLFYLCIVSLLIFNIIPINLEIVATIHVSQTILRVGCHLRMSKIERKYKWNLSIAYAFKEQFST